MDRQIIEADLTWTGRLFERNVRVEVGPEGTILAVGNVEGEPTCRLSGQALLPGFVNAHSHAFQRGLRGRGEDFPSGAGSFWSWREAMYGLVRSVDADTLFALCLQAFREMRAAGITAVGEFHYLHHQNDGERYALDSVVLAAAAAAGIRIVLLQAYYRSGGIGSPLNETQRRFETASIDDYLAQFARLTEVLDPGTQSLGVVAHSMRAASPDEVSILHRFAKESGHVFHMHVEEQPKEIEESLAAYGRSPMQIILHSLEPGPEFTAVHCTHSEPPHLSAFLAAGGNLCLTPSTEANLGDGIPDLTDLPAAAAAICLGSDSNTRISMLEEMRWLEYGQRLNNETRGWFRDEAGSVAPTLLRAATAGGARSLGLDSGCIAAGYAADLVAVSLNRPELVGWTEATLLDSLIFGSGNEAVTATAVGGRWIRHRDL